MILVACSKSKLATPSPARELYTGQLFRLCRAWVESQGAQWLILSAVHGVVEPETVIRPYNRFLGDYNQREKAAWGERVRMSLRARLESADSILFLAPRDYVDAVIGTVHQRTTALWRREAPWSVQTPLAGMGIGQQKAWVKSQLKTGVA